MCHCVAPHRNPTLPIQHGKHQDFNSSLLIAGAFSTLLTSVASHMHSAKTTRAQWSKWAMPEASHMALPFCYKGPELEHARHSLGRRSLNVCAVAEGAITPNFPWSPACLHRNVQITCVMGLAGFYQGASWQCDDPCWPAQRIRHMYPFGLFASSGTTALGLTFSMEDSKTLPMFWIFSLILFLFLFFPPMEKDEEYPSLVSLHLSAMRKHGEERYMYIARCFLPPNYIRKRERQKICFLYYFSSSAHKGGIKGWQGT